LIIEQDKKSPKAGKMAPLDDTTPETRFDSFNVYRIPYKKIGEHEIEAGILVSKGLKAGKHAVIVKFHGGGLVCIKNPTFFISSSSSSLHHTLILAYGYHELSRVF